MDERNLRLRLGVVVVAAAVILGILVTRLGDAPSFFGPQRYTLFVIFPEAPGIALDTPVRKSGITIGRVANFELLPQGGVRVTTSIDSRYPVFENEACRITSASVLGDSILEFVNVRPRRQTDKPLDDLTELEDGRVVTNPLAAFSEIKDDMRSAILTFNAAAQDVGQAARNLNTALANNSDQFPRILTKAEQALDQFRVSLASVDDVFGDPEVKAQLRQSLRELPDLFQKANSAMTKADKVFDQFSIVSDRASRNLENLENFTKPLGDRGEQIVGNLENSLANANELLEQLAEFSDGLNSREGTLGRLLYEDDLHDQLERTLANVEDLTVRIRPIIDDVRVVTDKVARDPSGAIGLKSIFDKRPIGTGFKRPSPMFEPTTYFFEDQ